MLLKVAIKKIEESKPFKDLMKDNKDFFLAHAFTMVEKIQSDWQVGYYNNKKDRVVVFEVNQSVKMLPEEEVFKKPGDKVHKLDLKKVKINLEKAINIAEKLVNKKYPAEIISKTICILQHLETEIYNLTLVTHTFNMINIKINATNKKVLSEKRQSILGLKKE